MQFQVVFNAGKGAASGEGKGKLLKVKLVSAEEGIAAIGFRRVAAVVRKLDPHAQIYFLAIGNLYSLRTHLFPSFKPRFTSRDITAIAAELCDADLLCFSSMTPAAGYVKEIIREVRKIKKGIFILWGGNHCIIYPDEALREADAICTTEGEEVFEKFYTAFLGNKNYIDTAGMWFNTKRGIIKNPYPKLADSAALDLHPYLFYGLDCQIYDFSLKAFRDFRKKDYLHYNGLSYRTVLSIGCPFSCIYCANDAFLSIDKEFGRIRHPSVDKILGEIEQALGMYPFISHVIFYDDNFIALPFEYLSEFCRQYKKRIGLSFVVFGMHPNFVTKEKVELLAEAGMNRVRMGIESASEHTLSFYQRHTPLEKIRESANILARAAKKYRMIPPSYDIISDNPIETRDDIIQTLRFLYELERPYTLTLFSLRVFPKTRLWEYFERHPEIDIRFNNSSYLETKKNLTNALYYLLAIGRPPRWLFAWLLRNVKAASWNTHNFSILYFILRSAYLFSRGFTHLCKCDSTTIGGQWPYYIWKMGLLTKANHRK